MTRAEATISVPFDARLLDDGGKFPAELRYRITDPFAVVIRFDVGSGAHVAWVFARELLEGAELACHVEAADDCADRCAGPRPGWTRTGAGVRCRAR